MALVATHNLSSSKMVIPVAVTSSAVVFENNYEYIGEVRGAVKAVGNAKDFNGAVN